MSLDWIGRYDRVSVARVGIVWSGEEKATLASLYPTASWDDMAKALPERTLTAIVSMAFKLSLRRQRTWSAAEEATLRRLHHTASWRELEDALPNRSRDAIRAHGKELKLRRPVRSSNKADDELVRQLHAARRAVRMSRPALADVLGWSEHRIAAWECGRAVPSQFALSCWATALGIDPGAP